MLWLFEPFVIGLGFPCQHTIFVVVVLFCLFSAHAVCSFVSYKHFEKNKFVEHLK